MTSSTNVKALIEKNNNKKGKHNDKIIPVILAAISAIIHFNNTRYINHIAFRNHHFFSPEFQ